MNNNDFGKSASQGWLPNIGVELFWSIHSFYLSPIINVGYLNLARSANSIKGISNGNGDTNTSLFINTNAQKSNGIAILPKMLLGYNLNKSISLWASCNYISGPKITTHYNALIPFGNSDANGFYNLKQFINAPHEEKSNTVKYSALNLNLGIGIVLWAKKNIEKKSFSTITIIKALNNSDYPGLDPQILDAAKIKSHSNQANNRAANNNSDSLKTHPQIFDAAKIKSHSNQANNRVAKNNNDSLETHPQIFDAAKIKSHSNQANNRAANSNVFASGNNIVATKSNLQIDGVNIENISEILIDLDTKEITIKKNNLVTKKQWARFMKVLSNDGFSKKAISIMMKSNDNKTVHKIIFTNATLLNQELDENGNLENNDMIIKYEDVEYKDGESPVTK
jgi:hypothetical protein